MQPNYSVCRCVYTVAMETQYCSLITVLQYSFSYECVLWGNSEGKKSHGFMVMVHVLTLLYFYNHIYYKLAVPMLSSTPLRHLMAARANIQ